jgi:hypothetical protein
MAMYFLLILSHKSGFLAMLEVSEINEKLVLKITIKNNQQKLY